MLGRPLTIDAVHDGGVYSLMLESLRETGLFFKVGRVDDVFVKMPSQRGIEDYRRYVLRALPTPAEEIRPLDEIERFEALDDTLRRFPELQRLESAPREVVHYLAVHRIQHERLRAEAAMAIPETRFALLRTGRLISKLEPVIFQKPVEGATLWQMFDFTALEVTKPWWPFLPTISAQLQKLLDSPLVNHIDWNIQNFVFRASDQRLFYVDVKPTIFVPAESNQHNLKGIREYFVD